MSKTVWWFCSKCGFKNAPHPYRKDPYACEQCGKLADESDKDREPV